MLLPTIYRMRVRVHGIGIKPSKTKAVGSYIRHVAGGHWACAVIALNHQFSYQLNLNALGVLSWLSNWSVHSTWILFL
jgi:hypothetical protein